MKPYRELWWPRFWPFLRVVDEMPSHRLRLPWVSFRKFRVPRSNKWYIRGGNPVLDGLVVGIGIGKLWFSTRGFFPAPPRKASNYIARIIIRRDVLRDEPWVLQQEIYESRYWLAHPWRLMHWIWFAQGIRSHKWREENPNAYKRAAAHLARVECASRAQEIRAYCDDMYTMHRLDIPETVPGALARDYARSIHGAKNYPWFVAAGWDEERVYQEIVRHL